MTQLESRKGIRCDLCHATHTDVFVYYSYELVNCTIVGGMEPSTLKADRRNHDVALDVCEQCHKSIADQVVAANTKMRNGKQRGKAFCELSGEPITESTAIQVFVTRVAVNIPANDVQTDAHALSFLISNREKTKLTPKPIPPSASNWETSTK